jgi:hypothetical protein
MRTTKVGRVDEVTADPPASGFRDTWFVRSRLDNVTIEVCQGYVERDVHRTIQA